MRSGVCLQQSKVQRQVLDTPRGRQEPRPDAKLDLHSAANMLCLIAVSNFRADLKRWGAFYKYTAGHCPTVHARKLCSHVLRCKSVSKLSCRGNHEPV